MIVDLITNSREIAEFVKKAEVGRLENKRNLSYYSLMNIPIGYVRDFNKQLKEFCFEKGIDFNNLGYIIKPANGKVIEKGKI